MKKIIGYEIHNLNSMTSYFVKESEKVACPHDRKVVEIAEEHGQTITCGKTIVEPKYEEIKPA